MKDKLASFTEILSSGNDLSSDEALLAFSLLIDSDIREDSIISFLDALRHKGETPTEILQAVRVFRAAMVPIKTSVQAIDIVGTGGDLKGTYNISTATAFVVAACGIPVAKHGSRAVSSRSGASDVLNALGLPLIEDPELLADRLSSKGLIFINAQSHHPALRNVASARKKLGGRTIFNLIGPLLNPAGVRHHLIGVFSLDYLEPLAEVLGLLGSERAWLAHSEDGLDEITTTGPTDVIELKNRQLRHFTLNPTDFGLPAVIIEQIQGGDAAFNADALKNLLHGARNAYRDIVLANSAAALVITGRVHTLHDGVIMAEQAIDSGAALALLEEYR